MSIQLRDYRGRTIDPKTSGGGGSGVVNRLHCKEVSVDSIASDTSISLAVPDIKFDNSITFRAKINTFGSVKITHGEGSDAYARAAGVMVDNTNVYIYAGDTLDTAQTTAHSLTILNSIEISIKVKGVAKKTKADVVVASNGVRFAKTFDWDNGCYNGLKAAFVGCSLSDISLKYCPNALLYDTWFFADSYMNYILTYMPDTDKKVCWDGYAGRTSAKALESFNRAIEYGVTPVRILWALGMNDNETNNTMNANWQNAVEEVMQYCEDNGVELILATIPNTSSRHNSVKNAYIRNSEYRYVDICAEMNADNSLTWYDDFLSSDDTHPTLLGSRMIAGRYVSDVPEMLNYE